MGELDSRVDEKIEELLDDYSDVQSNVYDLMSSVEIVRESGGKKLSFDEDGPSIPECLTEYEQWYNSAYPLVHEYLPDRAEDFESRYEKARAGIELDVVTFSELDLTTETAITNTTLSALHLQHDLLASIPARVSSESLRVKKQISGDLATEELEKARELFEEDNIRAAGVVAGVALERHLITLCESSDKSIDFDYMDGISSLAQTLYEADELPSDDNRQLDYLSGIRNKCSHASKQDPTKAEVERLVEQANDLIYISA